MNDLKTKQDLLISVYPSFKHLLDNLSTKVVLYVDLFCGAGGVSSGVIREPKADVIFAVNHDPVAIDSHQTNHTHVIHAIEDIRQLNLTHLTWAIQIVRAMHPSIIISLWASLECIHFSRAKGGDSRDADSRTLANHLFRYIEAINPEYIDIENVVEFMSWGPLRIAEKKSKFKDRSILKMKANGKEFHYIPLSTKKGKHYLSWVNHICKTYHYDYDHKILNSADFGAYTARVRYFGQFKKPQFGWSWPEPTHSKKATSLPSLFGNLKPWNPVKEKLQYTTGHNTQSTLVPAGTITTKDRFSLVSTTFIDKYYSGGHNHQSVNRPLGTILTNDKHNMVSVNAPWSMNHCLTLRDSSRLLTITKSTDTLHMRKIKAYMLFNGISDIKMRLLSVMELKTIQGFDKDYVLQGSQTKQKKHIGNSVEVNLAHNKCKARIKAIECYNKIHNKIAS